MIDLPHSLNVKPARTYCEEALLRGTWIITTEGEGIIPTPDEYEPAETVTSEPAIEQLWMQKVQSETRPNVSYTVIMFTDGTLVCDCPAGSRNRKCKHLGWAERAEAAYQNSPDFLADELVADAAPDFILSHDEALEIVRRAGAQAEDDVFGKPFKAA